MDKRKMIQALWAFTSNAHVQGFWKGKLYRGKLKHVCVPGLNCYSCPGALGACPIGSMQAVEGSTKYGISMYVLGFLVFVGLLCGRWICGWLCPFGLIQELLYKIPVKKIKVPSKLHHVLTWFKYVVLGVFVFLLPIIFVNKFGGSTPYFCKYFCPAGILEGGIPLMIANPSLREAAGVLFSWKMLILMAVIVFSVLIFRPFCKYLCPLGAFYGMFNGVSFYRYHIDRERCTNCGICTGVCKMNIDVCKNPNSSECIRCGECIKACPYGAISSNFTAKKEKKKMAES